MTESLSALSDHLGLAAGPQFAPAVNAALAAAGKTVAGEAMHAGASTSVHEASNKVEVEVEAAEPKGRPVVQAYVVNGRLVAARSGGARRSRPPDMSRAVSTAGEQAASQLTRAAVTTISAGQVPAE